MKKNWDDYLYNLALIILIWTISIFNYFLIKEPQIVFLFHFYPEDFYLLPRNSIFIIPLAFSFVILYNFLLGFLGINRSFINKLNTFIFLLAIIISVNFFLINY